MGSRTGKRKNIWRGWSIIKKIILPSASADASADMSEDKSETGFFLPQVFY
jgi:hypothetical protein